MCEGTSTAGSSERNRSTERAHYAESKSRTIQQIQKKEETAGTKTVIACAADRVGTPRIAYKLGNAYETRRQLKQTGADWPDFVDVVARTEQPLFGKKHSDVVVGLTGRWATTRTVTQENGKEQAHNQTNADHAAAALSGQPIRG